MLFTDNDPKIEEAKEVKASFEMNKLEVNVLNTFIGIALDFVRDLTDAQQVQSVGNGRIETAASLDGKKLIEFIIASKGLVDATNFIDRYQEWMHLNNLCMSPTCTYKLKH